MESIWIIYISLCLGILIGALNIIPKKIIVYNERLTLIGIFSLLFVMGLSIGSKKDIINNLHQVGLIGLMYAFFSVLFSIITVYLLTTVIFRRKNK